MNSPQPDAASQPSTAAASTGNMPLVAALDVLAKLRRDQIVVTTMGAAREWPKLSQHPLDFHYVPSAMGNGPALGLGLALAQSKREVIVLNGDGSMLMSLGSLVTLAAQRPPNLTLIVLNNGLFEVTGGQRTAATGAHVDWLGLAHSAGIHSARRFTSLGDWQRGAQEALDLPGPRAIVLDVTPLGEGYHLEPPTTPMSERIARFRAALAV